MTVSRKVKRWGMDPKNMAVERDGRRLGDKSTSVYAYTLKVGVRCCRTA